MRRLWLVVTTLPHEISDKNHFAKHYWSLYVNRSVVKLLGHNLADVSQYKSGGKNYYLHIIQKPCFNSIMMNVCISFEIDQWFNVKGDDTGLALSANHNPTLRNVSLCASNNTICPFGICIQPAFFIIWLSNLFIKSTFVFTYTSTGKVIL